MKGLLTRAVRICLGVTAVLCGLAFPLRGAAGDFEAGRAAFPPALGTPAAARPVPGLAAVPRKFISEQEAGDLFRALAARTDIAFRFPADGCYARAHLMARQIRRRGVVPYKAWAFAPSKNEPLFCRTPNDPKGFVTWGYHVAPAVKVLAPGGKLLSLVLDPALFHRPVPLPQWVRAQKRYPWDPDPWWCLTRPGQAPVGPDGKRRAGTGYWPDAGPADPDLHAAEVMRWLKPWEGREAPKEVLDHLKVITRCVALLRQPAPGPAAKRPAPWAAGAPKNSLPRFDGPRPGTSAANTSGFRPGRKATSFDFSLPEVVPN